MNESSSENCGLGPALQVISGKWKATIIWELHAGPLRTGALRRRVVGISEKVLFQQLRDLEAAGVVLRTDHAANPPKVEYSLTAAGMLLNDAVQALADWGERYAGPASRRCLRESRAG